MRVLIATVAEVQKQTTVVLLLSGTQFLQTLQHKRHFFHSTASFQQHTQHTQDGYRQRLRIELLAHLTLARAATEHIVDALQCQHTLTRNGGATEQQQFREGVAREIRLVPVVVEARVNSNGGRGRRRQNRALEVETRLGGVLSGRNGKRPLQLLLLRSRELGDGIVQIVLRFQRTVVNRVRHTSCHLLRAFFRHFGLFRRS